MDLKTVFDALFAGTGLIGVFWDVVLAVVILYAGRRMIAYLLNKIDHATERGGLEPGIRKFLRSLGNIAGYAFLIYMIADIIGVPTASLVALIGSAGVTIGLALQGSLSNFASGIILLLMHPFGVGDYVITGGIEGTVDMIGLFYTNIITVDNRRITVPNSTLAGNVVINTTAMDTRRLDFTVGISYDDDMDKAIRLLTDMLLAREKIIRKEDVIVYVANLGASSVDIGLRCWVNSADYWSEKWGITKQIKSTLDDAGITIPYNKLDVNLIAQKDD